MTVFNESFLYKKKSDQASLERKKIKIHFGYITGNGLYSKRT